MLSYIEISSENLIHNFFEIKKLLSPNQKIISVIKGNAYGHGQREITKILNEYTDLFGIDDIEELRILREQTDKAALLMGYIEDSDLKEAILLETELTIQDKDKLIKVNSAAKEINKITTVHIEIDSFLGRQGILLDELKDLLLTARNLKNIYIKAYYSHFSNIQDLSDNEHYLKQIENFEKANQIFLELGYTDILRHISATSGTMRYESKGKNDYVRIGAGIYGFWPSQELKTEYPLINLKPVIRWVSHVAQVKTLPADYPIGYGLTFITKQPTKIALIPQGYSDGYDRGLSNISSVLIKGLRCKVLGRISMNMMVVNVTHIDSLNDEEEVVLIGNQRNDVLFADELAEKIDTINYEITTRINPLLPRIIV